MGRVTEAHAAIERAAAAFDASGDADRLAARAAGQDAGVANLALMSWTLWLLGDVDTAVDRMEEAFRRADSIEHPHTRAYAAYYASVLHALRGDPILARRHAERCLALSEEHGFRQWRGLSRAVRGICTAMIDPATNSIEEVTSALDEYRGAGYQLGITALYVLLCRALILIQKSDAALEIIERGLATAAHNSERIFEAELYRLKAELSHASGAAAAASTALLERAVAVARSQGACSLELRAATDLAALLAGRGDSNAAIKLLAPAYAQFAEGGATQDLREAKALLDRLR
jgi:hypothetical protein